MFKGVNGLHAVEIERSPVMRHKVTIVSRISRMESLWHFMEVRDSFPMDICKLNANMIVFVCLHGKRNETRMCLAYE